MKTELRIKNASNVLEIDRQEWDDYVRYKEDQTKYDNWTDKDWQESTENCFISAIQSLGIKKSVELFKKNYKSACSKKTSLSLSDSQNNDDLVTQVLEDKLIYPFDKFKEGETELLAELLSRIGIHLRDGGQQSKDLGLA